MIPNVPPKLFSLSAVVVGYILIDDLTANEQNALGNWLMLVAQVLSTNAFYKTVMQERGIEPVGSTESGKTRGTSFHRSYEQSSGNVNVEDDKDMTLEMLEKMINAIQLEINRIKKGL